MAGIVQNALVDFFKYCPQGLVIMDATALVRHPAAVGPLINALSERGALTHKGSSVPTNGALYILVATVSAEVLSDSLTEEALAAGVKAQLVAALSGGSVSGYSGGGEDVRRMNADALRRRFDIVAQLKV